MALTPVTQDDFDRADGGLSNDSRWDRVNFYSGESSVISNQLSGPTIGEEFITNEVTAVHSDDQYVEITVVAAPGGYGGARFLAIGVRYTGGVTGPGIDTLKGYHIRVSGINETQIDKYDSGTPTTLYTGPTISVNDVLRLEVTGGATTELKYYINDVLEDSGSGYTVQDVTSPFTTGQPAVICRSPWAVDPWESGNITTGPAHPFTSISVTG